MASAHDSTRGKQRFNRWVFEPLFMAFPVWFVPILFLFTVLSILLPLPWALVVSLVIIVAFEAVLSAFLRERSAPR